MRIAIIGAGNIGATTAYTLINQLEFDELVLVDVAKELAEGQALDLAHAAHALGKKTKVTSGGWEQLKGAGIIVNSAGLPRKPGMTRTDLLEKNKQILESIAAEIKKNASPDAVLVQVANPSDALTYLLWKLTGYPREQVLGLGSLLDTERYLYCGGKGMVIGEHGETMVFLEQEKDKAEMAKNTAADVIKKKGCTAFGPAACICRIVKAIAEDRKELLPIQFVLKGEYGITDVAIGVPVKVGKKGGKAEEMAISKQKKEELQRSAEKLKEMLN